MKVRVRNNRRAAFGVEQANGRYRFVQPGSEKVLEVVTARHIEREPDIVVEVLSGEVGPVPAKLAKKVSKASEDTFSGFLDRSIAKIAADIPGLSDDALARHLKAERKGKSRKGLVAALEAEIEARTE